MASPLRRDYSERHGSKRRKRRSFQDKRRSKYLNVAVIMMTYEAEQISPGIN